MVSRISITKRAPLVLTIGLAAVANGDVLLDSYEGDVLPENAGFLSIPCDNECSVSLESGYLVFRWLGGSEFVNYTRDISNMFGEPPPPETFWVEWRFRSDRLAASTNGSPFCDAEFVIAYKRVFDLVTMLGDAVLSFDQTAYRLFPDRDFRTYRFECLDGISYRIYVDGEPFFEYTDGKNYIGIYFQIFGQGACPRNLQTEAQVNEWDFVRWGEIGFGEQIVSADPPAGVVDAAAFPNLDRFSVTFDSPNYVLVDEITVSLQALRDEVTQGRKRCRLH